MLLRLQNLACLLLAPVSAIRIPVDIKPTRSSITEPVCTRRVALFALTAIPAAAVARTPGSEDLGEAITQIKDAKEALRMMRAEWSFYAVIDKEGRAGNIDAARRVLGGVAPQRGEAAVAVAKVTPLYKIDGAFAAVRKAALNDSGGWGDALDIEAFVETGERVVLALQKADDSFYGVVFASKGSTMLSKIYDEAKASAPASNNWTLIGFAHAS